MYHLYTEKYSLKYIYNNVTMYYDADKTAHPEMTNSDAAALINFIKDE